MKIRAAVDARANADILIMARTDARAVHGFDRRWRAAWISRRKAPHHLLRGSRNRGRDAPVLLGHEEALHGQHGAGRRTPVLPPAKLQEVGYKLALYPVMLLSSAISAIQGTLDALKPGSKAAQPQACPFTDLQGIVGFPDYWSKETQYQA